MKCQGLGLISRCNTNGSTATLRPTPDGESAGRDQPRMGDGAPWASHWQSDQESLPTAVDSSDWVVIVSCWYCWLMMVG